MKHIDDREKQYFDSAHRLGRIETIIIVSIMVGIPFLMARVYNIKIHFKDVMRISSALLAVFVPAAVSEFFSYMPILGSSTYLTYLTGNVLNLKIPCVLNAQELTNSPQGTERGDVVATIAVCISSITTMVVIIIGVILMIPMTPFLQLPVVKTATQYILPALFGAMFIPMCLNNTAGNYVVKNRLLPILVPIIALTVTNYMIAPIAGKEGYWILATIIISITIAWILYKKGIIKMIKKEI